MIGLSTIRSKMKTRGRLVLSVFAIAWMSATLQPCLMAMEISPNESASISASGEQTGHQGHQGHSATISDQADHACPHCPPSTSHDSNSCASSIRADCDALPDAKPGDRILKVDLSDAFADVHSSFHYFDLDRVPLQLATAAPNCEKPTFVFGPSISIRNCVFLK